MVQRGPMFNLSLSPLLQAVGAIHTISPALAGHRTAKQLSRLMPISSLLTYFILKYIVYNQHKTIHCVQ